jgi:hypothetical protein
MDAATFFALFWGWLTIVFTAIPFVRPNMLIDLKQRVGCTSAHSRSSLIAGMSLVASVTEMSAYRHSCVSTLIW